MRAHAACSLSISMLIFFSGPTCADSYPTRPLRIITAEAGGGSDFATRLIAPALGSGLGQHVIVDNRGLLAAEVAAKAAPDGYSLLLSGATLWLLPFMREKVPYQIADFSPLSLATKAPNILVIHPSLPAKSVKELIALAKAKPGELNYATSGTGNSVHIAGELFRTMTGLEIVRVNYKGAARALTELSSGQVQLMFAVPGSVLPHVKAGRLTALAVTSPEPSPLAPGLPAVAATLPGYESVSYLALFAPAGTHAPIIHRLNEEIVRALHRTDIKARFFGAGLETVGSTRDDLAAAVRSDMSKMGNIIRAAGIRADY